VPRNKLPGLKVSGGGSVSNETDPPAGDFISAGGDFSEGETLFCDTGYAELMMMMMGGAMAE